MNIGYGIFLIVSVIFMCYGVGTDKVKGGILSFITGLFLLIICVESYGNELRNKNEAKLYEQDRIIVVSNAKISIDEENKKAYVYYIDSEGYTHKIYFEN